MFFFFISHEHSNTLPLPVSKTSIRFRWANQFFFSFHIFSISIFIFVLVLFSALPFVENHVLPTSSSEDGLGQVFSSEVRRSRRYMSKRTSGTFREYLNSRNIDLAFNCSDESYNKSTESTSLPHAEQMEFKQFNLGENQAGTTTKDTTLMRKGSMRRTSKSAIAIKCDKNGNKLDDKIDDDIGSKAKQSNSETNGKARNNRNGGTGTDTQTTGTAAATTKIAATPNNSFLKKYIDDVSKPKNLQFESTDDWYASASDMDDSDSAVSKPYGYNAVNPVLECVNQVSRS